MSSPIRSTPRNAGVPPHASTAARALGDEALVAAMRSGDDAALREFLMRFHPLLIHHAARLGIEGPDREDMALEVLEDAALRLTAPSPPRPRSLAAYLVTALRNRHLNARRAAARGERLLRDGDAPRWCAEPALTLLVSEGTLRDAHGPLGERTVPEDPLSRLGEALVRTLTADEHQLMVWASNHVPYREIAVWLGIGYAAVGKRIERLRTRLRAYAAAYATTLADPERERLAQFFHRAGLGGELRGGVRLLSSESPRANDSGIDEDSAHAS